MQSKPISVTGSNSGESGEIPRGRVGGVDPIECRVLSSWESGERELAQICRQAGIGVGGNQYIRVRGILAKYGKLGE